LTLGGREKVLHHHYDYSSNSEMGTGQSYDEDDPDEEIQPSKRIKRQLSNGLGDSQDDDEDDMIDIA